MTDEPLVIKPHAVFAIFKSFSSGTLAELHSFQPIAADGALHKRDATIYKQRGGRDDIQHWL